MKSTLLSLSLSSEFESMPILQTTHIPNPNPLSCPICLENILEDIDFLPYCHFFHRVCIRRTLLSSRRCPVCRYELPSAAGDAIELHQSTLQRTSVPILSLRL